MQSYELLEKEFGVWISTKPECCVAVNNGTTALHLALETLRLPPSAEVATSEFNMIADARAITMAGLTPVFVDCRKSDLLIDTNLLDKVAKRRNLKAILAVHIYGRQCNMTDIHYIAEYNHNIAVIEDLSEAHGVMLHPKTDAACWSFYKNKIIHGEEGGMIAFKNPLHAKLARLLRSQGFTEEHDFMHITRGINGRMPNCCADLILSSLRNAGQNILFRKWVADQYTKLIPMDWILPVERMVDWVFDIRIKGMTFKIQDQIINQLKEQGIEARHGFKPMSMQPEYSNGVNLSSLNAFKLAQEVLYLPIQEGMTLDTIQRNVEALKKAAPIASNGLLGSK